MRVRFDTVEEFLEELGLAEEALPAAMPPPILRLTCTYTPVQRQALRATVVAGVLIVPFRQASLILQTQSCKALVRLPGRTRICTGVIACSLIFDLAKGTEHLLRANVSSSNEPQCSVNKVKYQ